MPGGFPWRVFLFSVLLSVCYIDDPLLQLLLLLNVGRQVVPSILAPSIFFFFKGGACLQFKFNSAFIKSNKAFYCTSISRDVLALVKALVKGCISNLI